MPAVPGRPVWWTRCATRTTRNCSTRTGPGTFVERGVGLLDHVVVRPSRRRRGVGTALVRRALVAALRQSGALLVTGHVEEGGAAERFAEACGFQAAYPVTGYVRRVDELLP
ncbi:GNAT family N-acetyltransferase [Gandjariella thermophila]|uniref:N-acetyltransferase domain-containing protein n=1 Tax=Gandjariella thermophila TaxID=1931992 RepID=A0A4D4JC27_9PSEU|nr:GNAT family N-acetyltransferase [Gandjariella thermophila]GDY32902.1 hypothetical protein GTS_45350 [Gandjariella thermophila]